MTGTARRGFNSWRTTGDQLCRISFPPPIFSAAKMPTTRSAVDELEQAAVADRR